MWGVNFALEYAIGMVQVNQEGFKLNGTHPLLVYGDSANIQDVPLPTKPGSSLIILTPMTILQRDLNRSTFVV
jgi:hypothetical protein